MQRPRLRVPRIVRWLLVVLALAAGWAAGNLLDEAKAARGPATVNPAAPPATRPVTMPQTKRSIAAPTDNGPLTTDH